MEQLKTCQNINDKVKKQVYGVLEKSICFMNGCCEVGMIWKDPIQDTKKKK